MKICFKVILFFTLATSSLYAENLRVEPDILAKNLSAYIIIDTRENSEFLKEHIKGALNFPISSTYENQKINGKISSPETTVKILRNLGLNINVPIVIYDTGVFFDAARLFWTLEVYGFKNIKILNTGFDEWKRNNYPTGIEITKRKPSNYVTIINTKRLATKFTTQIATKNPNQLIIDARASAAYKGEASSAQRFGHIPSAQNIPATNNISHNEQTSSLKSISQLKDIYKNVDKSKKIVIYCAVGRVSSTNYFALRELGYDVANYDSSWMEWGNDFSLPIVAPKNK